MSRFGFDAQPIDTAKSVSPHESQNDMACRNAASSRSRAGQKNFGST